MLQVTDTPAGIDFSRTQASSPRRDRGILIACPDHRKANFHAWHDPPQDLATSASLSGTTRSTAVASDPM